MFLLYLYKNNFMDKIPKSEAKKELGYDEWVQMKVAKSLARLKKTGSQGKSINEAHTSIMEKIRKRTAHK
jgi:hypothetical protein